MTTQHWIKHSIVSISTLTLLACGGGGGSDSSSSTATNNSFPPSSEKLLSNAGDSSELYVEEDFKFNHIKHTSIEVHANDENQRGIPYARLNIYLLDSNTVASDQEMWMDDMAAKAQLIAGGQTNSQGQFTRIIEFAGKTNENPILMIEVNALGIENKTLVTINSERTIVELGM